MMRNLLVALGVLLALVVAVVLIGWSLPVKHRASRQATVRADPDSVFALISNVAGYASWRTGVKRIEMEPEADSNRRVRFREFGADGEIPFEITALEPNRRMVTRIASTKLPFGGTWTYEISPAPGGAALRITEDGEVYNPVFRFISRFVMGHSRTIDRYLKDVARKFGAIGEIVD
jgi:hypothetical protein